MCERGVRMEGVMEVHCVSLYCVPLLINTFADCCFDFALKVS